MKNPNNKIINRKKGFVMLFAVLISSLVLSVGISVISIALKQIVLSGTGRESQYAFYAANTGTECALYWDYSIGSELFSTSTAPAQNQNIKCLGREIMDDNNTCTDSINSDTGWCREQNGNTISTKFRISFGNIDAPCADVIVKKNITDGVVSQLGTTITSRGYNTCNESNPRRVERALEYNY